MLRDLAVVLLAAGTAALLCHRLRQPKVLGYILAGLVLGPHTPPFPLIRDAASIRTLADLGVIFLMFSLGIEFNLRRFRRIGATAGVTAVFDVAVMVWLGYLLGRRLGWSPTESFFLGGILCDSSTTVLAKVLHEMGRTRDKFAGVLLGITVMEDVLAVGMMAVLTGLAVTGAVQAGLLASRFWILLLFIVAVTIGGLLTLPRFLDYLHRFENDELLVVTLLGICFGVTLLAARLELSLALGAVLVGAVASESRASQKLGTLVESLRHVFSAVFFVAVGLMLNPAMLLQHWMPVLAATVVVIVGKFLMNTAGSLLTGHDVPTSLRVGAGMAQIGEFAFIIAALGVSLGVTGDPVYQVGVGAAVLTTLLNPYLLRWVDRLAAAVDANPTCRRCTAYFTLYGLWVERIGRKAQGGAVRRAVRRSMIIMAINTILTCAVLAVAGYLARHPVAVPLFGRLRPDVLAIGLWSLAMLVSLPMFVVTVHKLQAVGMVLAEVALPMSLNARWARTMRGFVANAILAAGTAALLFLTFILSSALLPSREVFALLMLFTGFVAVRWGSRLGRVYAQAQRALTGMLQERDAEGPALPAGSPAAGADIVLNVETVAIGDRSAVLGKDLGTARLRERTGATVVAIERGDRKVTNPGPRERMQKGDRVYVLGDLDQIRAAKALLGAQPGGDRP